MKGATAVLSAQFNPEHIYNNNNIFTICPPPLSDVSSVGVIPPIDSATSSNFPLMNQSMDDLLNELSSKSCSDSSSEKLLNDLPYSSDDTNTLDYSPTQPDTSMHEFLNIYGGLLDSAPSMPRPTPHTSSATAEVEPFTPESTCLKQGPIPISPPSSAFNMKNMINSLEMLKEPDINNVADSNRAQNINSELEQLSAAFSSPKISVCDTSNYCSVSPTSALDAATNISPSCPTSLQKSISPNINNFLYPRLVLPPNLLFVPIVPAAVGIGGVNENHGNYDSANNYNASRQRPRKDISKAEARKIRNRLSAARSNLRRRNRLLARKSELGLLHARINELKKKEGSIRVANEKLRQEIITVTSSSQNI